MKPDDLIALALKLESSFQPTVPRIIVETIRALHACVADRENAERYRWLVANRTRQRGEYPDEVQELFMHYSTVFNESLDEAIDAAREGETT